MGVVAGEERPVTAALCTALTLCAMADKVVLVVEADDVEPIVAVMSVRESHSLRSRMHKATNDAAAAAARGATA